MRFVFALAALALACACTPPSDKKPSEEKKPAVTDAGVKNAETKKVADAGQPKKDKPAPAKLKK